MVRVSVKVGSRLRPTLQRRPSSSVRSARLARSQKAAASTPWVGVRVRVRVRVRARVRAG